MNEQDVNLPTSKFISSLVKSLQIICNGHVDFSESIELVGHINVRIDHKFKYNYIVDEHVSKEGEDSSTTFLSNSYHSTPPFSQNPMKDDNSQREDEISLSLPVPEEPCGPQLSKSCIGGPYDERDRDKSGSSSQMYSVNVGPEQGQVNDMVFKMEDVDDSDACMMLPSAVDGFSAASGVTEPTGLSSGPSRAIEDTVDGLTTCGEKNKRRMEQDTDCHRRLKEESPVEAESGSSRVKCTKPCTRGGRRVQTKPRKFLTSEELGRIDSLWTRRGAAFACNQCPYSTGFRNRVRAHCRSVHMGIPRQYKGGEKGSFVCDQCGKEFTSKRGFRMHMQSKHLDQFPHRCPECGKGFMSVSAHRDHINMHAGVALQCVGCETLFYTEYGLKRHLLRKHPELL